MKRICLIYFSLTCSLILQANTIINGIEYTLSADTSATVVALVADNVQVTIPDSVYYCGISYVVKKIDLRYELYLKKINIPKTVETVSFYNCINLENISLPPNLKRLGLGGFGNCAKLEEIVFPNTVKFEYMEALFQNCSNLKSVSLPDSTIYLGLSVFANCTSLKTINLPSKLEIIGSEVFKFCTSLYSLSLPAGLKEIKQLAFFYCESLKTINIPAATSLISQNAFEGCTKLTNIEVDPRNPYFYAKDGVLYKKGDDALPWCDPMGKVKK